MSEAWRLAGYAEVEVLGTGGFGRVVLAKHEASGSLVAIKYLRAELLTNPQVVDGFRREAQLLHGVHSPHVARLYDFVETAQGAALVMEAVPGVSLRALLAAETTLAPESALAILKGSLLGLAAAHSAGVVHRDYKPGNVLVSQTGESKLVDFGLATLDGHAGLAAGSPSYMAPEQWAGRPGLPATDVYAATCVFFQCITGRRPFEADTAEHLRAAHQFEPIPLGPVPEPLRPLIARGMAKDPALRPATAHEFVAELEAAARAAYGEDWEQRGWKRLAAPVAALTALTPLALLVTGGTAAAPGAVAGGVGAALPGTGLVSATVGKVIVAVLAIGVLVAGGLILYLQPGEAPRQVALTVEVKTMTGQEPSLPITYDLQYPQVSGHADAAVQQRINAALRAPADQRLQSLRQAVADPGMLAEIQRRGDVIRLHSTAKVMLQTQSLLSVRYDHDLDSDMLSHSSWRFPESVNVDLGTGQVLGPREMFRTEALTEKGMATLTNRLIAHSKHGWCRRAGVVVGNEELPLASIDAAKSSGGGEHVPAADIAFTDAGVDFLVLYYDLGCTTADWQETITVPYGELTDLVQPQLLTKLGKGDATPAPSSTTAYTTYTNARFGFTTPVPAGYGQQPDAPVNGDGVTFTDPSLDATFTVWGANNAERQSTQDVLSAVVLDIETAGGQVTFQRADGAGYTVSGYRGDGQIFYERGYVGRGSTAGLKWVYPREHKAALDAPVSRTADGFRPGDLARPH